jgi:hypothetical protein
MIYHIVKQFPARYATRRFTAVHKFSILSQMLPIEAIPFYFLKIYISVSQSGFLGTMAFREGTRGVRQNADECLGVVCYRNYSYRLICVIMLSSE